MLRSFLSRRPLQRTVQSRTHSMHVSKLKYRSNHKAKLDVTTVTGSSQSAVKLTRDRLIEQAKSRQKAYSTCCAEQHRSASSWQSVPAHFVAKGCSTSPATSPAAALAITECLFFMAALTTFLSPDGTASRHCYKVKAVYSKASAVVRRCKQLPARRPAERWIGGPGGGGTAGGPSALAQNARAAG